MKVLLIIFLFIIILIYNKSSKVSKSCINWVIIIGFSLLIALAEGNADFNNYKNLYETASVDVGSSQFEFSYKYISFIFSSLKVHYQIFLFIISFFALILINKTVIKYSRRPQMVMFLYFLFPLMFDSVQIRNFLAMAFVVFSIRFLLEKKSLRYVKYLLCILVAMSFHSLSVIYLAVPVLMFLRDKSKIVIPILSVAAVIFIYTPFFEPAFEAVYELVFMKEMTYAYFSERPGLGLLVPIFLQLVATTLVFYSLKTKPVLNNFSSSTVKQHFVSHFSGSTAAINGTLSFNMRTYNINKTLADYVYCCIIFFPLYAMTSHMFRVFRNIYILVYIIATNSIVLSGKRQKTKIQILLILLLVFTYVFEMVLFLDAVIIPFLF